MKCFCTRISLLPLSYGRNNIERVTSRTSDIFCGNPDKRQNREHQTFSAETWENGVKWNVNYSMGKNKYFLFSSVETFFRKSFKSTEEVNGEVGENWWQEFVFLQVDTPTLRVIKKLTIRPVGLRFLKVRVFIIIRSELVGKISYAGFVSSFRFLWVFEEISCHFPFRTW